MSRTERIIELVKAGASAAEVASVVGVSATRVYQILKDAGVPTPRELAFQRRVERAETVAGYQKRKGLTGPQLVRCRRCRRGGVTNLRLVGRATWIDLCGSCKREVGEA